MPLTDEEFKRRWKELLGKMTARAAAQVMGYASYDSMCKRRERMLKAGRATAEELPLHGRVDHFASRSVAAAQSPSSTGIPVDPETIAKALSWTATEQQSVTPKKTDSAPKVGRTHLVIPDTQVKPGVPMDHLRWIGQYIADRKPDVIIHLGDHWDMPSLSTHDPIGSLAKEGARYEADVASGNEAFDALCKPWQGGEYLPECHFLTGNHEQRIERAINSDPRYAGTIGYHHLNAARRGFTVHPFLKIASIDGVWYSHYLANPLTGRPWGGTTDNRLNKIGHSFTQGHEQTYRHGSRFLANGLEQHALICGASYLHDELYKGLQGNQHWRGIIVKHEVRDGSYDIMRVSLGYLCRRYERMTLGKFLAQKYPGKFFTCVAREA